MLVPNLIPVSSGFDSMFEDLVENAYKLDETYPPYSIYSLNDEDQDSPAFIEIALAGFSDEEIEVFQDDDGYLVVKGEKKMTLDQRKYSHRGISYRRFEKKFKIDKNFEPGTAVFENGLLTIRLNKVEPKKRSIPIIGKSMDTESTEEAA